MMQTVSQTLLDKMGIDEAEIELRKRLMGFREEDAALIQDAVDDLLPAIDDIVDEFFVALSELTAMSHFSIDDTVIGHLKARVRQYLISLLGGEYQRNYMYDRLSIGIVHERNGVEPKFFIAAMKRLKTVLRSYIARLIEHKATGLAVWNAVDSMLCFDTLFVLDAYFYSYVSKLDRANSELEQYAHSLEEMVAARTRELEELSRRDSLTNLYNHRAFTEFLRRDLALAIRNSSPLCLVYIDVDEFKFVNDRRGHREGDEVLKHIGWVLAALSRESDTPCRYGGDEFCIILPSTFQQQAHVYCQRVAAEFKKTFPDVTLSFGIAQSGPVDHFDMDTLIRRADSLMYTAKRTSGSHIVTQRQ